jgi:hypothetical protein
MGSCTGITLFTDFTPLWRINTATSKARISTALSVFTAIPSGTDGGRNADRQIVEGLEFLLWTWNIKSKTLYSIEAAKRF